MGGKKVESLQSNTAGRDRATARKVGVVGEEMATRYLKQNHFEILKKKYRAREGEIDIIAKKDGMVSFIEVKTRTSTKYGSALESVSTTKQKRIIGTALHYLTETGMQNIPIQFCLIAIQKRHGGTDVQFIENAFEE